MMIRFPAHLQLATATLPTGIWSEVDDRTRDNPTWHVNLPVPRVGRQLLSDAMAYWKMSGWVGVSLANFGGEDRGVPNAASQTKPTDPKKVSPT